MSALPDLVRDSKLSTTFSSKYTTHLVFDSSAGPQKQTRRKQYEERWAKSKALGSKPFGRVWLEECAVSKGPAKLRAVKQIPKTDIGSKPDSWHRELEAIIKFSHQKYDGCFVRSSGWFEDTESIFIAMEYIPKGDLSEHLAGPLPEVEARKITYQILEGIQFMHENSFAHRDLKPANIFVVTAGPDWWVKIGDFGISKRIDDGQTALRTINGTPGFIAPEIVAQLFDVANWANFSYTLAVDLWSLGVICFFMLTGRLPFHKTYDLMTYFRGDMRGSDIFSDIHDDHKISKEASSFMKTLLAAQPTNRGRVAGALSHVWLQGLKLSPLPSGSIHTETLRVSRSNISRISMVESDASAQWSVIDPPTADTVPKYETPQTSIIVCHEEKCERNDPSRRFPTIDDLERHKKNVHPDSLELDPQKIMYPCFGKNCPRPNRRRRLRDLKHHLHRYHPSENESKLIKKSLDWYDSTTIGNSDHISGEGASQAGSGISRNQDFLDRAPLQRSRSLSTERTTSRRAKRSNDERNYRRYANMDASNGASNGFQKEGSETRSKTSRRRHGHQDDDSVVDQRSSIRSRSRSRPRRARRALSDTSDTFDHYDRDYSSSQSGAYTPIRNPKQKSSFISDLGVGMGVLTMLLGLKRQREREQREKDQRERGQRTRARSYDYEDNGGEEY